jgi:hypothetical protein
MTFSEYMILSKADQKPIDYIVEQRIVARLIIKNSLNEQLQEYLVHKYSVNNNSCYPNTISDVVSLLSTFTKVPINNNNAVTPVDAIVSYHEVEEEDVIEFDDTSQTDIPDDNDDDHVHIDINHDEEETEDKRVSFRASVMANVIAEASAAADENQLFGASFAQLQDVDDAYEDDEPDLVCYAHVVDPEDDKGVDVPDFVADANNNCNYH